VHNAPSGHPDPGSAPSHRLQDLATLFLKLGTLAFGGPAAHIAMMEDEVVVRKKWMTRPQLLDLLGATNLIPGPNSTELAIHIGFARAGWRGLIVSGVCFILPAMGIVWTLAMLYVHYQSLPQIEWILYGIKPVMVAIIAQALWRLGQTAVKDWLTGMAGAGAVALSLAGFPAVLLLVVAGMAVLLAAHWRSWRSGRSASGLVLTLAAAAPAAVSTATSSAPLTLMAILGFFLKVGAVLYGSGYVLLAFLQHDLVERWQWITSEQLLDAVAIGQLTPGPVFTTATFIGYLLAGHAGALLATLGIFLPSFVFVAAVNPWIPRLRQSAWAGRFLDGVNVASLALMAVVTWKLATTALVDWATASVAVLSGVGVFYLRINSAWLILGGAVVGLIAMFLR
jgi:chromate transporter